ncbi:MAG: response regulator [Candidatus Omnitrophota bacterium]
MRVLVADDETETIGILQSFLERRGCVVDCAADGKEALELIKNKNYDVAFIDHNMPELTGLELIKYIKLNNIRTKTVMLTGYGGMADFLAESIGADAYIEKPFSLKDIESFIKE